MNIVYYDSGTTNTRAYLFLDGALADSLNMPVGSKDTALSGSKVKLLSTLVDMLGILCARNHINTEEIGQVWMSGMISSPTGIVEIPHLTIPIDLPALSGNVTCYYEPLFFKRNLYIIPGVRTNCQGPPSLDNVHELNNMRGEETEVFGILQEYPQLADGCIMIMPGSHTQVVFIRNGAISNIISTITGELYSAVRSGTILSTSLPACKKDVIDDEMLCKGYENLKTFGFNRALYTVRTLELFMETTPEQRHSYFEGILNGGVLDVICQVSDPDIYRQIAVYGSEVTLHVFRTLLGNYLPGYALHEISSDRKIPYSVSGFQCISSCKNFHSGIY